MKSEERQKLAKERREEKAKYFGKYSRGEAFGDMLPLRRAPPSARVEACGAGVPVVVKVEREKIVYSVKGKPDFTKHRSTVLNRFFYYFSYSIHEHFNTPQH